MNIKQILESYGFEDDKSTDEFYRYKFQTIYPDEVINILIMDNIFSMNLEIDNELKDEYYRIEIVSRYKFDTEEQLRYLISGSCRIEL